MAKMRRIAAAAPLGNGGRNGHQAKVRGPRGTARRPDRADDRPVGVGHSDELVASRGEEASRSAVRIPATGRGPSDRADAFRSLATRISVVAAECRCRAFEGVGCDGRLSVDDAELLTIDARIAAGDRVAVVDAAVEAGTALLALAAEMSEVLTDDRDALVRLAEIRLRKSLLLREKKETGATDCAWKEPRGPRKCQETPRRAMAGEPENGSAHADSQSTSRRSHPSRRRRHGRGDRDSARRRKASRASRH